MSRNSDKRKIKDVQNVLGSYALQKILALEPVQYRHIDEDPTLPVTVGFIAQDFEKAFPDLIRKRKGDDGVKPIKKPKPPQAQVPTVPGAGQGNPQRPIATPADPISAPADPGTLEPAPIEERPVPLSAFFSNDPIPNAAPVPKPDPAAAAAPGTEEPLEESATEDNGYSILSYEELIPMLVAGVKELAAQLQAARDTIAELEKKVKKLTPSI